FRFADHIDAREALEDLFPQDAQLHLGDAIAHAAMNAEAKRNMMAGPVAVDAEFIGPLDHLFVAIARDVPHDDAVALPDLVALELDIAERSAAHMGERRLVGMISETMLVTRLGSLRSFSYSSGFWFSASRPPDIELRVVSLPPTISSIRLPRYSIGLSSMFLVAGSCASSEMKSNLGGAAWRSCHSRVKYCRHSIRISCRRCIVIAVLPTVSDDVVVSDQ